MLMPVKHARLFLKAVLVAPFLFGAPHVFGGIRSGRILTAIARCTPAPQLVAKGTELAEADKMAAKLPRAQAFLGVGRSMEPLYAPNTAVIVQQMDYNSIKKGMTVVYVNRRGVRVAHSVIGETHGGYIVQGVNNDDEDADLLTEGNFVGVITHAFASSQTEFRSEIDQRYAARDHSMAQIAARS